MAEMVVAGLATPTSALNDLVQVPALRLPERLAEQAGKLTPPRLQAVGVDGKGEVRLHLCNRRNDVCFLVDTSSVVFLMPPQWSTEGLKEQQLTLYGANASPIHTYGSKRLMLNLSLRRDLDCEVILADVLHAILGADFLAKHELLVELKNCCLIDPLTGLSSRGMLGSAILHTVSTVLPLSHTQNRAYAHQHAALLQEFADILRFNTKPIQTPNLPIRHIIATTGPPVFERLRRLVGEKLAAARRKFDSLLEKCIIRPPSRQWSSPLHMVKNKDGT
ncbi:uncharacterized protein LOC106642959 [Copidosoma floridanum]|uniref:uncharacterized protein LOC106642959 n=1 Tax=Copidosoma floridanum TaxID=29053 RepID=UPI0006C9AAAC|nr:uncharacterized protein LOC106642959 [Copidosoma floridanum]